MTVAFILSPKGVEASDVLVRERGLEPLRACAHKVLSLARLPFRHSRVRGEEYRVNRPMIPIQDGIPIFARRDRDYSRSGIGIERAAPVTHNLQLR
jgi:hypothetical protein